MTHPDDWTLKLRQFLSYLKSSARGPKHQLFENPGTVAVARLTGCKNIVPAERVAANQVRIPGWDCDLMTVRSTVEGLTHIGVSLASISVLRRWIMAGLWQRPAMWMRIRTEPARSA